MIRECFNCHTGIIFDPDMLREKLGMDVDMHHQRFGTSSCESHVY
jgi:hypothetical protein